MCTLFHFSCKGQASHLDLLSHGAPGLNDDNDTLLLFVERKVFHGRCSLIRASSFEKRLIAWVTGASWVAGGGGTSPPWPVSNHGVFLRSWSHWRGGGNLTNQEEAAVLPEAAMVLPKARHFRPPLPGWCSPALPASHLNREAQHVRGCISAPRGCTCTPYDLALASTLQVPPIRN